jgi:DNA-binding MarR family transcriptional regulator
LLERLDQDLKSRGVTHDDYGVLVALSEAPGDRLRMAELALRSVESRSRLSHHIGRLESKGLVRRESCASDGRGLEAVLTPQGRAIIESIAPHHVVGVRSWFLDHLSAEELQVIGGAFSRIDESLVAGCKAAVEAECSAAGAEAADLEAACDELDRLDAGLPAER